MPNVGPPPVQNAPNERGLMIIQQKYDAVTEILRANKGVEARAMQAMFDGDKTLFDKFLAVTLSLLAKESSLLQDATPLSIVHSIKDAASLGLTPMTDDGVIIARSGIAAFQPMYRGYLKRIRNSREVSHIDAQLVMDNDEFEYSYGGGTAGGASFTHKPTKTVYARGEDGTSETVQGRGGYWGVYAYAIMPDGFMHLVVMDETEVNYIRDTFGNKTSRSGRPLPWATSWGEMAKKTAIRRLAKLLPAAAVDKLLALDAANDRADEALAEQVKQVQSTLVDVQKLALQAVGQLPAGDPPADPPPPEGDAPTDPEPSGGSAEPGSAEGDVGAADPAPVETDDLKAAMALADEQERLRRYRESQTRTRR